MKFQQIVNQDLLTLETILMLGLSSQNNVAELAKPRGQSPNVVESITCYRKKRNEACYYTHSVETFGISSQRHNIDSSSASIIISSYLLRFFFGVGVEH